MQLLSGIALFVGGLICLLLARPKSGKARWFVGTSLEVPITLLVLGAIALGGILTIAGIAAPRL